MKKNNYPYSSSNKSRKAYSKPLSELEYYLKYKHYPKWMIDLFWSAQNYSKFKAGEKKHYRQMLEKQKAIQTSKAHRRSQKLEKQKSKEKKSSEKQLSTVQKQTSKSVVKLTKEASKQKSKHEKRLSNLEYYKLVEKIPLGGLLLDYCFTSENRERYFKGELEFMLKKMKAREPHSQREKFRDERLKPRRDHEALNVKDEEARNFFSRPAIDQDDRDLER